MTLGTAQESSYEGKNLWTWAVYLTGAEAELDEIDHVVYHLHSSFKEPIRVVRDRATAFRLEALGWGTFQIRIEVVKKDESLQELVHDLELYYPDEGAAEEKELAGKRGAAPKKKAMSRGAKREEGAGPRVFLSYSASDETEIAELKKVLVEEGIDVVGDEDLDPGRPWRLQISEMLDESDAVIGVVAGSRVSRIVTNELSDAARDGKPVLIVNTGEELASGLHRYLQSGYLESTPVIHGNISKKLAGEINTSIRNLSRLP